MFSSHFLKDSMKHVLASVFVVSIFVISSFCHGSDAATCPLLMLPNDVKQHKAFDGWYRTTWEHKDPDKRSWLTLFIQMYDFKDAIYALCRKSKFYVVSVPAIHSTSDDRFHTAFMQKLGLDTIQTKRNWKAITKEIRTLYERYQHPSYFTPLNRELSIPYPKSWGADPYMCSVTIYNKPNTCFEAQYAILNVTRHGSCGHYFFLIPQTILKEAFKNKKQPFSFALLFESRKAENDSEYAWRDDEDIHAKLLFPYEHNPRYNFFVVAPLRKPSHTLSYTLEQNKTTKLFAYHAQNNTNDNNLPKEIQTLLEPIAIKPKKIPTNTYEQFTQRASSLIESCFASIPFNKPNDVEVKNGTIHLATTIIHKIPTGKKTEHEKS